MEEEVPQPAAPSEFGGLDDWDEGLPRRRQRMLGLVFSWQLAPGNLVFSGRQSRVKLHVLFMSVSI